MWHFQPLILTPEAARAVSHTHLPIPELCTFLQWVTAPVSLPIQALHSVTSCREPTGNGYQPRWSCR